MNWKSFIDNWKKNSPRFLHCSSRRLKCSITKAVVKQKYLRREMNQLSIRRRAQGQHSWTCWKTNPSSRTGTSSPRFHPFHRQIIKVPVRTEGGHACQVAVARCLLSLFPSLSLSLCPSLSQSVADAEECTARGCWRMETSRV